MSTRGVLGFLFALTLLACSETQSSSDAGGSHDSGGADHDAAMAIDAATHVDSGSPSDAATSADAATSDASISDAGSLDASTASDAGHPASPCAFIESTDRHCLGDGECAVAMHQVNCCGTFVATGISANEAESFAGLEAACEASYPACGCATQPTTTDSGETVSDPSTVHVGCITRGPGGICMTYVTERPADGR